MCLQEVFLGHGAGNILDEFDATRIGCGLCMVVRSQVRASDLEALGSRLEQTITTLLMLDRHHIFPEKRSV